jgi:lipopolysaccharide export system protein LptA
VFDVNPSDNQPGLYVFLNTGNASITQGVVAISAEKIQIFHKKQIISKVIATSTKKKLVHYRQNQFNQYNNKIIDKTLLIMPYHTTC